MINAIYYPYVNTRAPERRRHTWRKIDCTVCSHAEELVFFYFIVDISAGGFKGFFFVVFLLQLHIFKSHFQF